GRPQHVVVFIAECLRRRYDNRISGVDSKRIKVFHVANRDAVVMGIADDLVLDFLPALHASFDQHLPADLEGFLAELEQLLSVLSKSTTEATQRICRADDDRIAD